MSLLIDADFLVYKCCAANESEIDWGNDVILVTSNFSDALRMAQQELYRIASDLGCYDDSILFFSDSTNFRKTIDPEYKGHRNRKKPCGYRRVINALSEDYPVVVMPTLEADDAIGIYATKESGHIICSPDKDMKQIPGELYDFTNEVITITKEDGDLWHLIQTMSGDQTDGYAGVPGIGIKRAAALLEKNGPSWQTVVDAFAEKGLGEDTALTNARLAKILQHTDYDFQSNSIRFWSPPCTNSRNDNGAEVQAQAN
jgi:DNA polymerase-1